MDTVMRRLALLVIIVIAASGCGGKSKREKYLQGVMADQAKYEQIAKGQEVDGEKAGEARTWLEWTRTDNVMNSMNEKAGKKQVLRFAEDLYEAGATRVMCIYTVTQTTFKANMCNSLLIELPKEKEKRAEVFKEHFRVEKEYWGKKATKIEDQGQKYLHLNLEP
jgi:hypothetical protein